MCVPFLRKIAERNLTLFYNRVFGSEVCGLQRLANHGCGEEEREEREFRFHVSMMVWNRVDMINKAGINVCHLLD